MIPETEDFSLPAWLSNDGPDSDVVFSTRIRLARNLSQYRFPHSATLQERKKIFDSVSRVATSRGLPGDSCIYNFCGLPPVEQEFLVEERVASPDLLKTEGDRGVVCDSAHRVSVMINEEDHIRFQVLDCGERSGEIWKEVDELDTAVASDVDYAFDERKGYLTTCPTNSGTGMRVSFLLHLPGMVLTRSIDQVLQGASQMGISTRGFLGEHSEIVGGLFQLSNQATLGVKETELIETTRSAVQRIVSLERQARRRVLEEAKNELEDKVFRSCGILLYARTLAVNEFLTLASTMRLGLECSLIESPSIRELNRLMLSVMPAHLKKMVGNEDLGPEQMGVERANIVRKFLKGRV